MTDERAIANLLTYWVSAYVLDAAVNTFVYHYGPFLDVLTSTSPTFFSARIYILTSFVVLGIFIFGFLTSRRETEERLFALNFYGIARSAPTCSDNVFINGFLTICLDFWK